ncbi:hypothetical protein MJO52_17660 [Microbulbifer variabilis]|uniref:DUF4328 domain-containing protein n=1 Tax=Microbulbifer variabilis TaxID=266805 RepID=A0ABY4VEJ7_9GAMM|nr:hypothetical protein [Microbulbifer variabilis]USD20867.1 hypothetical protein MJO52_17660 [Microbulbifer variabilis]
MRKVSISKPTREHLEKILLNISYIYLTLFIYQVYTEGDIFDLQHLSNLDMQNANTIFATSFLAFLFISCSACIIYRIRYLLTDKPLISEPQKKHLSKINSNIWYSYFFLFIFQLSTEGNIFDDQYFSSLFKQSDAFIPAGILIALGIMIYFLGIIHHTWLLLKLSLIQHQSNSVGEQG